MAQRCRPTGRFSRGLIARTAACVGLLLLPATFPLASAAFAGSTADDANSVSTATVAPPSALAVTQTCAAGPGIVVVGVRSANGLSSLTLIPPDGTVAGHLLVAQVVNRDGHTLTAPPSWTPVGARTTPANSATVSSAVFWKWAAEGEGASTFTLGTADVQMVGGVTACSGVHPTSPVHQWGIGSGIGAVATAPSVTTTVPDTLLVYAFAKRQEATTAPAGTTPHWSLLSGSGSTTAGAGTWSVPFAGPGATGTVSRTGTTSWEWVAHTLALRPAPGPPSAALTWTASPSTWATGYRLERSVGGTVQSTATVTPISTSSTSNGTLVNGTTYSYRLWAYYGTWVSTAVTAGLTPSC
jgi:hypothetical protein